MDSFILIFVCFFVLLMFLVGALVSKRVHDSDDFFLGGRNLPSFLLIATLLASEVGGGVMLGSVGYGYTKGWGALWYLAPMAIGLALFGLIMSKRLKTDGDQHGYISMFEWLSGRFDNAVDIRLVGAIVMLTGFIGSLASQFIAMGTALSTIIHIDKIWGLVIGGIVVIVYASLGGLLSVVWTDLLQAAVFVFGMLVLLPLLVVQPEVGGIGNLLRFISGNYPDAFHSGTLDWRIGMIITMSVAPFVRQYYYQRMFAARTGKSARVSIFSQAGLLIIIAVWTVLVGSGVNMINPLLDNPEEAMPWVLSHLFHPIVSAIILSAIVACIMSTADTFINAASLTLVRDIIGVAIKRSLDKKKELSLARVSSLLIGFMGLAIALGSSSVMSAIQKAWSILGGGLFCPMVISYFWKKSTHQGVFFSMIVGFFSSLICIMFTNINAIFISLPLSFFALIVFSLIPGMNKNSK